MTEAEIYQKEYELAKLRNKARKQREYQDRYREKFQYITARFDRQKWEALRLMYPTNVSNVDIAQVAFDMLYEFVTTSNTAAAAEKANALRNSGYTAKQNNPFGV